MIEPLASNNPAQDDLKAQRASEKDGRETSQSTLPDGDTAKISPEAQDLLDRLDKVRRGEEGGETETGDPRHEEAQDEEGAAAPEPVELDTGMDVRDASNDKPAIVDQIEDLLDE